LSWSKNAGQTILPRAESKIVKQKRRKPDTAAGNFAIAFGGLVLMLAIFASANLGRKLAAMSSGLMLLGWGIGQVVSAKKWRGLEDKQDATNVGHQLESDDLEKLEKSGSMQNVFKLLGWIFLFVVVASIVGVSYLFLFHRKE
jgi:hypothetical protein